jgi:ureidoacrylate peracid hydrolase
MTGITMADILSAAYRTVEAPPRPTKANSLLLLIDVQQLATPEHLRQRAVDSGLPEAGVDLALADYGRRFYSAVDNCAALLRAARSAGVPSIHVKIEALSSTARDTGPAHRRLGWCYPPGSPETRFLDAVAPLSDEVVITKTVSGAFTSTNLDAVLRHMGIDYLYVCGFETDECIEATARAGLDLGYLTLIAADATTTYEAEAHGHVMAKYASWGLARTTEELVVMIASLPDAG